EDFGLRPANDENAFPRHDAHEAFGVELSEGFPERRAGHAEARRKIALVELQFRVVIVDIHLHDRGLERRVGLRLEAQIFDDRGDSDLSIGQGLTSVWAMPAGAMRSLHGVCGSWYTIDWCTQLVQALYGASAYIYR